MENASKALIIAGAILLSIMIIGLGIMIFTNARDQVSSANLDRETIDAFNSTYVAYEGERVKGSQVRTLIGVVRSNNLSADDINTYKIGINGVTDPNALNAERNKISTGKNYSVTLEFATADEAGVTAKGLVKNIVIADAK